MLNTQHFILLALAFNYCHSDLAEDEAILEACKDVRLTANRGRFVSPNYPNPYLHKCDCKWTITAPKGHRVRLSFSHFDIYDPSYVCNMDFVTIWFNKSKMVKYCNDNHGPLKGIESMGRELIVELHSDDFFANGKGFDATYEIITNDGVPVEQNVVTTTTWYDDWDETEPAAKSTSTSKPTTTSTTPTTTSPSTPTTKSTTTATTMSPSTPTTKSTTTARSKTPKTTTLKERITNGGKRPAGDDNTGISNNPGAMSGAVIGSIIGVVLIIFGIILIVAFVHWRRNKNQRIDLSTVEIDDGKTLIKKKYKKQNNKIVRIPEAETFPL